MARTSPWEFAQQVRTEVGKVTWPSRDETVKRTIAVLVMVVLSALFFLLADQLISRLVAIILGLGR